jgi:hypothetical protein
MPGEAGITDTEAKPQLSHISTMYTEICRSYHAVDDFRMKLLGSGSI